MRKLDCEFDLHKKRGTTFTDITLAYICTRTIYPTFTIYKLFHISTIDLHLDIVDIMSDYLDSVKINLELD